MSIYAMKVDDGWSWPVHESLKNGEGRFGCSYVDTANLHDLRGRIARDGWDSLDVQEKDCYQEFLLSLESGDYVVYVNLPEWGQCTLAEVTGPYFWRWSDRDFNHRFPVARRSVRTFDRNDARVAPGLSARLKRRGRCYRIHAEDEFRHLVQALRPGAKAAPGMFAGDLHQLGDDLKSFLLSVTEELRRPRPHVELEHLVERLFRRLPGVRSVARHEGAGEGGADILVELEVGSIPQLVHRLVVHVRPPQDAPTGPSAVDDMRRAIAVRGADMALVVSTETHRDPKEKRQLDRLAEDLMKPVALLDGGELTALFLQHGAGLLFQ